MRSRNFMWLYSLLLAALWAVFCWFAMPDPPVGFAFRNGTKAEVAKVVDPSGHFRLEVKPADAAKDIYALAICGVPCFPRVWLTENIRMNAPLGSSGTIDCFRLFDLLSVCFHIVRACVGLLPLAVLLLFRFGAVGVGFIKACDRPLLFSVCLIFVSIMALPAPFAHSSWNVDPSWIWFLNHYAFAREFGTSFVFTYGPLGFLLRPGICMANAVVALAANLLHFVCLAFLLWGLYSRVAGGRKVAWLLLATLLVPQETMEWRWVLLAILFSAVPAVADFKEGKIPASWFASAGCLAAFISFMKFTSLTTVIGTQLFCAVAFAWRRHRDAFVPLAIQGMSFLLTVNILAMIFFQSFSGFMLWILGSHATAQGYNAHMVVEKPWGELLFPIVVGVFFWTACGWRYVLLFAPVLFCAAKYAWVRQGPGPMIYLSLGVAALSFLARGGSEKGLRAAVARMAFVAMVGIALVHASLPLMSGLGGMSSVVGINPSHIVDTILLPRTIRKAQVRTSAEVAQCKLPDAWRLRIGVEKVSFVPFEYGPAIADDTLKVSPLPSIQVYSACHPDLDARNAEFFSVDGAPHFVIVGLNAHWSGHFINYPRMWKALLENYTFVDSNGRYAFMERCADSSRSTGATLRISDVRPFLPRLKSLFLRPSIEYATLVGGDGSRIRLQLVRGNQGVEFPLKWIPIDNADMLAILKGDGGSVSAVEMEDCSR